jgi:predicted nucleic acid-binding Zn ribbon protein
MAKSEDVGKSDGVVNTQSHAPAAGKKYPLPSVVCKVPLLCGSVESAREGARARRIVRTEGLNLQQKGSGYYILTSREAPRLQRPSCRPDCRRLLNHKSLLASLSWNKEDELTARSAGWEMGIASVVLAVLTVSFLCFPWVEPLVALVRRRRRLRLPRPPAATGSAPAAGDDGAAAVTTTTILTRNEEEEEVEDIVKDEQDDVQSTAGTSRSPTKPTRNLPTVAVDSTNEDDTNDDDDDDALPSVSDPRQWRNFNRCFCEDGGALASFLPPGLLQDHLQSAGALLQLGAGGCYHKSTDKKRR